MAITLVSWNLLGSQSPDLDGVAAALADLAPDVVVLQEVQRRQLHALRDRGGFSAARWTFKHWPVRVPSEGLGLLARGAIDDVATEVLSRRAWWWSWRRRVAQHARVTVAGGVVRLVNVHLAAGGAAAERVRQVERLLSRCADADADVVAGDLNETPGGRVLARFAEAGWYDVWGRVHAGTPLPATNWRPGPRTAPPVDRLDYVLVPDGVEATGASVPADWERYAPLSDHLPVVATLEPRWKDQ